MIHERDETFSSLSEIFSTLREISFSHCESSSINAIRSSSVLVIIRYNNHLRERGSRDIYICHGSHTYNEEQKQRDAEKREKRACWFHARHFVFQRDNI